MRVCAQKWFGREFPVCLGYHVTLVIFSSTLVTTPTWLQQLRRKSPDIQATRTLLLSFEKAKSWIQRNSPELLHYGNIF
jgi:hypothetical protein